MSASSAKQSDTSSRSARPVLLLDQTFSSPKLALAIACDEWDIELHGSHFPGDAKDHEWIPVCGANGWVVVSCDKQQRSWRADGGLPRQAIIESKARVLFLGSGSRPFIEYANALNKGKQSILRHLHQNRVGPLMMRIHNDGRVERLGVDPGESSRDRTRRKFGV
jgi:hypothetical protein